MLRLGRTLLPVNRNTGGHRLRIQAGAFAYLLFVLFERCSSRQEQPEP
jgi:hypothetical protein